MNLQHTKKNKIFYQDNPDNELDITLSIKPCG